MTEMSRGARTRVSALQKAYYKNLFAAFYKTASIGKITGCLIPENYEIHNWTLGTLKTELDIR